MRYSKVNKYIKISKYLKTVKIFLSFHCYKFDYLNIYISISFQLFIRYLFGNLFKFFQFPPNQQSQGVPPRPFALFKVQNVIILLSKIIYIHINT